MNRSSAALLAVVAAASVLFLICFSLFAGHSTARELAASPTPSASQTAIPEDENPLPPHTNYQGPVFSLSVRSESQFIWPAVGPITSYFGAWHPGGIDIGFDPGVDSPIVASAAGTVSFAGGVSCCDYGLHVIIDHGNGMNTLYGHLSKILVTAGQQVAQGELLGLGGNTGISDGKHLHFEVHQQAQLMDPLRYLSAHRNSGDSGVPFQASCPADIIPLNPASKISLDFDSASAGTQLLLASLTALNQDSRADAMSPAKIEGKTVSFEVPPATASNGKTFYFLLSAVLSDGDSNQLIDCELAATTIKTQPNSENTAARLRAQAAAASAAATAAAVKAPPEKTPTPKPPTATPVPTKKPTTSPPKGLTQQPPKGLTVQPPKGRN